MTRRLVLFAGTDVETATNVRQDEEQISSRFRGRSPCGFFRVVQVGEVKKQPLRPHLEKHGTRGKEGIKLLCPA